MKLAILAIAPLTTAAVAQDWPPYYDTQSKGFRLQLLSTNVTFNGCFLGACHQGAAQEGLCPTLDGPTNASRPYTTFYHNVSSAAGDVANADNKFGVLGWTLTIMTGHNTSMGVSSAMSFQYFPQTNLADMTFSPGYDKYTSVAFEAGSDRMYIETFYNDLSPPQFYSSMKLENWYICLTRYHYMFETLAWKVGAQGEPQNPSCQSVGVRRVWI